MNYYFTPNKMAITVFKTQKIKSVGKDVVKLESLYFAGRNAKQLKVLQTFWQFFKNFNMALPHDSTFHF